MKIIKSIIITSLPPPDKIQLFFNLSFNSTMQFISGILRDLQYFNSTAIAIFSGAPLD